MSEVIRPGDTVLIGYDYPLTREKAEAMLAQLEDWFPGVEFHFIMGTVQAVMRGEGPQGPPPQPPDPWKAPEGLSRYDRPPPPRRPVNWTVRGRHIDDAPDIDEYDTPTHHPDEVCWCAAHKGDPCVGPRGEPLTYHHEGRLEE